MIRCHCRFTVLATPPSLYLFAGLLLHLLPVNARAAERTYDQWYSEMPAVQRAYARSLATSIKKNVPDAKQVDPRKFTYGDKQVVDVLANRAVAAARERDEETAVAAWLEVFRINNVNFAHTAGYEASPAVLREVARFFLPINRATRDERTPGSAEYLIWDTAVKATQRLIDAK